MNRVFPREAGRVPVVWLVAAGLLVVVALGWALMRRPAPAQTGGTASQTPDGTVQLTEAALREAGLDVQPVQATTLRTTIEAPGVIALDERRTARIGSQVEGKVLEVFVEIGDRAQSGKELAHMISPVVHEAWAAYRKALSERRRAQTDLTLAVQQVERVKRLLADKAVAQQEVQRAEAGRVSAEEGLNIVNTELRRSQEEMEHLGVTNSEDPSGEEGEQIPVRSPLSGVVLEKFITEGGAVTPGTPLFLVSDLSSLWALAEIDETTLPHVQTGRPVDVRVAAYPSERFPGTITWVSDTVNPKTRRVTVRCALPNPTGRLKPDMYATVSLGEGEPHAAVTVPSGAVQDIDGKPVVFVENGTGRFARRDVTVGAEREGRVEVQTGLQAGERVVVKGGFLLKSELLKSRTVED
jgi:membrane fusion protein, heavy metal efflux system